MKKVRSIELIEQLEVDVERHIQIALWLFQNLNSTKLLRPSSTGGWSIAQCFEHLNSYGNFYLPHIEKALKENKNKSSKEFYTSGWLGNYFKNMMDPKSGKKYMAFKDHIPAQELNASAVVQEFIEQQELLLKYLEQAKLVDLNSVRIPISITSLIRLKLGDVFQFLITHNDRHILQARRNTGEIVQ